MIRERKQRLGRLSFSPVHGFLFLVGWVSVVWFPGAAVTLGSSGFLKFSGSHGLLSQGTFWLNSRLRLLASTCFPLNKFGRLSISPAHVFILLFFVWVFIGSFGDGFRISYCGQLRHTRQTTNFIDVFLKNQLHLSAASGR